MPLKFKTIVLTIGIFLLTIPLCFAVGTYHPSPKFVPPEDKILFFIGQDHHAIDNYIKEVGIVPAGFTFYTSIQNMDGINSRADHGGGIQHASYTLDKYPFEAIQIGLYMVGACDDVLKGKYDNNIRQLGKWIKESHKLVYLRIGYEFDNPENNYQPEEYKKAYQYIVNALRKMSVKNVAYVWHSYASERHTSLESWYPGNQYADWVAITYFNPYNTDNMDEVVNFAQEKGKPVMIAEASPIKFGTNQGEETWKRWFAFIFDYIEKRDIKAFCYINCNWDELPLFSSLKWGDARIEINKEIKSNWLETINQKKFYNYSPDLRNFASKEKRDNY